jgi:cell division protein FtsL
MTDLSHNPSSRLSNVLTRCVKARSLWSVLGVLCIMMLTTVYVFQVAEAAEQGYQLRDLEQEVSELQLESEQLSVQIAESKSLSRVSERMQILGFVPAESTIYITGTATFARSE